ncbi:MAG: energy transducer TonB, partial [Blastocatellia bacterium]
IISLTEVPKKMGKVVKYCSSCDEGFAERFGFCPNCGASLQAFELNPLASGESRNEEPIHAETPENFASVAEPAIIADEVVTEEIEIQAAAASDAAEAELDEPEIVEQPVTVAAIVPPISKDYYRMPEVHADAPRRSVAAPVYSKADDGGYYVTVIQEKNSKQRNVLLLGATVFMLTLTVVTTLVSLFQKDLRVGAIDEGKLFSAVIVDDEPMTLEEEQQKKDDDDGGGGGGGGKDEEEPVNKGDLPDQSRTPTRPPDPKVPRLENPSLALPPPQTEGDRKFEKKYVQWGDPNSRFGNLSSGPGTGGGTGTGTGTGAGSGSGTGAGSGTGSGSGSGNGDGNGSGSGPGGDGAPPPVRAVVTSPYRIISKPKATYTDAARTANVQGNVRLKITLLASGQVGSITPVSRLPHGLTEQAIAAARQIRFEPKKVNGVATSVVVTFDYGFNIY